MDIELGNQVSVKWFLRRFSVLVFEAWLGQVRRGRHLKAPFYHCSAFCLELKAYFLIASFLDWVLEPLPHSTELGLTGLYGKYKKSPSQLKGTFEYASGQTYTNHISKPMSSTLVGKL